MVQAIHADASIETITATEGEDAEAAFLRAYTADAEKPSETDEEEKKTRKAPADEDADETSEETPEDEADEDEGEETDDEDAGEEESEDDKSTNKKVVLESDAEAFVKHKVDGKEVEIPVKDLTRLYGQEAALTRKSQEAAEARKAADDVSAKYAAGLEALAAKALERFKPYAELNFLALSKDPNISAEDLAALQKQATDAYNDVQFLNTKLEETVQAAQQERHTNLKKAAVEAWKVLSEPSTGIEGWDEAMYNDIRAYTIKAGIPAQTVNELVDPVAIKLLHKAMLFDKAQTTKAKVEVKKVDKQPKKIIKSSSAAVVQKAKGSGESTAAARLKRSGDVEDAEALFLSRMTSK